MRTYIILLIALLFMPGVAQGLGADHDKRPVNNDGWPKGLADLVNSDNRIHGFFVNWQDYFFFAGDSSAFNEFLQKYSQLLNTRLQLVIHPGKLEVKSPWDKQPRDLSADWKLYTSPYGPVTQPATAPTNTQFITRIDLYLGGSVKLDDLKIPENVPVESGGEIEGFVKKHQAAPQ